MEAPFNFQQQQANSQGMSGVQMKANAYEYDPEEAKKKEAQEKERLASSINEKTNLLNEDTSLYVTSENQLLAATSFEQMSIDPRFIDALYFCAILI